MLVIERYILRRVFSMFATAMFWTLAIVWTTQVLARVDLVTDSGQSALTFFKVALYVLPSVIPLVLPFALLIAVAQTLSVMNSDSELAVISAAGASRRVVMQPVLLLAVFASLLSFAVHNFVDPYARQSNRMTIAAARADFLSLVIQEGTFRRVEDGLFVQIGERLPDGGLGSIFVADSREEGLDLAYYAKRGTVIERDDKSLLLMFDGEVQRKTPGGDVSVIRFTSYAFDLSVFAAAAEEVTLLPKDRTLSYLLNPDANDRIYQKSPQLYRAELHQRFAEWLYPLAFALIALAVASDAKSHREARFHPVLTAATIGLLVRWLGFLAANNTRSNALAAVAVYGVPLGACLISYGFILTNRAMDLPTSFADRVISLIRRIVERLTFMRLSWRPRRSPAGGSS